ncbi:MAG: electron transport complex subunit RsxC [Porticoccaceae bacterium]|nr:electron transport complex subunit RsxC [Porticoccaceae bacterium]
MRKIWDIPGGIHPPENKHQSLTDGIGTIAMPERLILPLNQHAGAPAKPLVKPGDRVLKGQMIAEPVGFISAALHAPTSGTIDGIADQPVPHPSGMSARCIELVPDGRDEWCDHQGVGDYRAQPPTALLELIRNAGITGLGGAGFPSSVKLGPRQPIDTLVINGTECEPYITADDSLMQARAPEIIEGVNILRHILGNPETVLIGIEDNKPRAFEQLTEAAEGTGIEVVEFPTKYPSGGEKQLIQILTGKEVPSGKLPAELGIVCQNVGTTFAVYNAICRGEPLISRITTVTGQACGRNGNYEVLLGTPISHLLAHNDFDAKACTRLVMGGPMMGFTLLDPAVPVVKTTNCILAGSKAEFPPAPPAQACIRCGLCAEACPASLLPQQLYWYAQSQNHERLEAHNLFDCIECGACAYVCPSRIPLVQYYRAAKGEIRRHDAEQLKADHARQRFEFHKARLEKAEAEKAAKREARRLAAEAAQRKTATSEAPSSGPGSADDLIQAAKARAAAKKASPDEQKAKLERSVEANRNRLKIARDKLAEGRDQGLDSDAMAKLEVKVNEAALKLKTAEEKLASFDDTSPGKGDSTVADDAASRVMDRVTASRREQLETTVASLKKRIASAEQAIGAETADATIAALQSGLEKQRQKLAEAETALAGLGPDGDQKVTDPTTVDAASAAIARAQAKAAARASMTPEQKAREDLHALDQRIAKARDKAQAARAEDSEHAATLESALEKLEEKRRGLIEALGAEPEETVPERPVAESVPAPSAVEPHPVPNDDPAAAAIARAQAKAREMAAMTPEQKRRVELASLDERIAKARSKLDSALAEGSEHVEALQGALEKLENKRRSLAQQDSDGVNPEGGA